MSQATKTVSEFDFRSACALFPTGVTVVTRLLTDGSPYGMTVSSFTSVSLQPPMILVCIDKRARMLSDVPVRMSFAVNILNQEQQPLAVRFSRLQELGRFNGLPYDSGPNGVPLVQGAVASFICTLEQNVDAGDHHVLIASVDEIRRAEGYPLVWCGSTYHCLPRQG